MKKINWCKKQEKGIRLIEPNDNLSEEYFQNSEESLRVLRSITETKSNMWLATTKYYIEYFAIYSLLMKIGIKCEIHDCTIALVAWLENEGIINKGTAKILENDKELRIDNQYYLKNKPVKINFEELLSFIISIKEILGKLNYEKIAQIRRKIKEL
jgi:uncharacterized protein (UPF0332 family)